MEKCCVCNNSNPDVHHIKSRGSSGSDHPNNLVPLCRNHHTQIHQYGKVKFCRLYPNFKYELIKRGWCFCHYREKWVNDNNYITS